jgi:hypothetical protein
LADIYNERNHQIYVSRGNRKQSSQSVEPGPEKYTDFNSVDRERQLQKMNRLEKDILRRRALSRP